MSHIYETKPYSKCLQLILRNLGRVVLLHTTLTSEMHHVRTCVPTPKQWFGFQDHFKKLTSTCFQPSKCICALHPPFDFSILKIEIRAHDLTWGHELNLGFKY
jgi:hypothetical protein